MPKLRGTDDIIFANLFLGIGTAHGVINVQLGAMAFSPVTTEGDDKITTDVDPIVTARLRLTEPCARILRDALTEQLERITKAADASPPAQGEKLN